MSNLTPTAIKAYDVRIERGRGRRTVHVAAVDSAEAQAQAADRNPDWRVVSCRRSQYAVGASERRARVEWKAADRAPVCIVPGTSRRV